MKSKTTAALLALFLGSFGVHKFYLRDPGSGIFFIILTIFSTRLVGFSIAGILGVIDAIALFTMSEERFDAKYNSGKPVGRDRRKRPERRTANRNPYQQTRDYDYRNAPPANRNPYQKQQRKRKVVKDNPFKTSGIKRLKDFELDLAEQELLQALELSPDDKEIHMALGKVFSLTEQKKKSFYHIAKAVQLGYKNVSEITSADELAYLRIQPEFEDFEKSGFRQIPAGQAEKRNDSAENNSTRAVEPPADDLLQDDLLLSQLNKLQELRKKGLLSEAEFLEEKTKLMRR